MNLKKIGISFAGLLLVAGGLTSCGPTIDPQEAVDKALAIQAIATDADAQNLTDKTVGRSNTFESGNYFVGATEVVVEGAKVKIDWTTTDAEHCSFAEHDETHVRSTFTFPEIEGATYEFEIKGTASYKKATGTIEYKIRLRAKEWAKYRIKDTYNLAANDEFATYGYITWHYDLDGHLYAGAGIADGTAALMLYSGKIDAQWEANELQIGDLVKVSGTYAPYNGLRELKPAAIEKVTLEDIPTELRPEAPVDLVADPATWTAEGMKNNDSRVLADVRLVLKEAVSATLENGKHWTLKFAFESDPEVAVTVYQNYHVGDAVQTALKAVYSTLAVGDVVVISDAIVGWYNGPQITPLLATSVVKAS